MSTRRPKSVLDQDRYTAELSTGQLVIGVCILLMFGLGCFLLGVLIGKFDPTLKTDQTQRAENPRTETAAPEIKVSELPVTPPQVSPSVNPPANDPVLPPEMRAPANILKEESAAETPPQPQPQTPAQTQPQTTAPAAGTQTAPPGEQVQVTPPSANATAPQPAPAETPKVSESVAAAAERNRIAPPTAQPQAVDAAPAAQTPPASAETGASLTPWKGYGVQILAVAKDRAESARKDLESKSSYKARVLPHARNDLYRVVVGPYADQASATRARDDLRARGFKDAFVLTLQ